MAYKNTYKLDSHILSILEIQDEYYTDLKLGKILSLKYPSNKKNFCSISKYLYNEIFKDRINHYSHELVPVYYLITTLKLDFIIKNNKPNCDYYSYSDKPNYKKVEFITI